MLIDIARILIIIGFSFLLFKHQRGYLRKIYWYAWSWKILAGLGVGYLYHFYYASGDTLYFFSDATTIASIFKRDCLEYLKFLWTNQTTIPIEISMEPRTLFFTKLLSIVGLFVGDNYWVMSLYCSWIAFCGAWYFVTTIDRTSQHGFAAMVAFLGAPVEIFWSSGIQKESIVMPCLYVVFASVWQLWKKEKVSITQWLGVLMELYVCWKIKYFYVGVAVPILLTSIIYYVIQNRYRMKRIPAKAALWFGVFILPLISITFLHPNFYVSRILQVIVENYNALVAITDVQNLIVYPNLEPTIGSMLYNAPKALFSAFFRPFLGEVSTFLQWLVSFENAGILILAIGFLWNLLSNRIQIDRLMIFTLLIYSVVLGVMIALSTPSFGTLIRFRVGFMPFLIFIFLMNTPLLHTLRYRLHSNDKNEL